MTDPIKLEAIVPLESSGSRLDQVAAELFDSFSRSRLQQWIKSGDLLVDGKKYRPKDKLLGGESLSVNVVPEAEGNWEPEPISLDIAYEDDHILVINKPAGLVVHPAAGNYTGTLLNGLLHHVPSNESIPRAGIVHRLDKDTTGLMVVAKSLEAHNALIQQLQARSVHREYQAITQGVMTGGGTVDEPMARHPQARIKMAVVSDNGGKSGGKDAITHYRVIERFPNHTHIRVKLETGRTHQIRVHMAHIGYSLVGDMVYGGRLKLPKGATAELQDMLRNFKRQALHAGKLGLIHPVSEEYMEWQVPPPEDLKLLLEMLKKDAKN
jgi:23S rRNA pseudouridine1911/1915/1917 synthase